MTSVERLADEWLHFDKDPSTRHEISSLLSEGNLKELEGRLKNRIAFGTAGLRGRMEAGFSRMNSLTVIQTSQGLASYVLDQVSNAKKRGIVIGFDGRHNSSKFARLAATAFVTKGIRVWWLETLVHTPLVPFAIGELDATAGVMITASHNPPHDNGYKVYWENGCQIISPHDQGISNAILANLDPVSWRDVIEEGNLLVEGVLERVRDAYFEAVRRATFVEADQSSAMIGRQRFIYTPMHGVGLPYMTIAVQVLQVFDDMVVVPQQAHADPDFPTVKFPNPEEEGALDLATKTADENSIDLVLANDPDADRFSAAVKVAGTWRQLTGNQIGVLLASYIFEVHTNKRSKEDRTEAIFHDNSSRKIVMFASIVSSRMLSAMADREDFHFVETLTGFKWLGNTARDLALANQHDVLFAYEEAIGYMFPTVVYDKDGITAAAMFLRACHHWKASGLTSWAKLDLLYQRYGYFAEENFYIISPSPNRTDFIFSSIRSPPREHIGPYQIDRWRDLTYGYDSATSDHTPVLPVQRGIQMIIIDLHNDVRLTLRASGTEPKIKIYIDARAGTMSEAERTAKEIRNTLMKDWLVH